MLRLLLPGIRLKRWLLIALMGMLLFGLGFSVLLSPQLDAPGVLWRFWIYLAWHEVPRVLLLVFGVFILILGVLMVLYGSQQLLGVLVRAANPEATKQDMVKALLERYPRTPKLKVVGIGGGTGLSTLLRGLKAYPVEITAIVTVSDDGGSSGRLRADLDMPPPGDILDCLIALADAEPMMERLFQFRFAADRGTLAGHTPGNLVIAGLNEMTGDFLTAIDEISRVLAVRGRVLPSADRALILKAQMDDGQVIYGETAILEQQGRIHRISLEPPDIAPLPQVLEALRAADVIVVGPGSVYSSLLPNLILPGVAQALSESTALKFFVCNVLTQPGESDHFTASHHLEVVLEHLPVSNPFDYALLNRQIPAGEALVPYLDLGYQIVEPDAARLCLLGTIPVLDDFLRTDHPARHDPDRLARSILSIAADKLNWQGVRRTYSATKDEGCQAPSKFRTSSA